MKKIQYILFKKELQIDGFTKMYGFFYTFLYLPIYMLYKYKNIYVPILALTRGGF